METAAAVIFIHGPSRHSTSRVITKAALRQHRHSDAVTEILQFPDRGDSLIDGCWRDAACACLDCLGRSLRNAS
jgi:hypothetical protein